MFLIALDIFAHLCKFRKKYTEQAIALFEQMIAPHFQTLALPDNSNTTASNLLEKVDLLRPEATRKLQQSQRKEMGCQQN